MKAKLVYVSFITRVVVEDNATEDQILEAATPELALKVFHELHENIDKIIDDVEVPYKAPDTITTEFELTKEVIDDFMCAALEGGINYWCYDVVREDGSLPDGVEPSEWAHEYIGLGGNLRLKDGDDGEYYLLTPANFAKGFIKACENWKQSPKEFSENFDAESADCVIQFAIFGSLIYG